MAGLGRRTFTAGEVLTAANVQDYLQDQAVMVFAGTATRASAIPTPTEGMVCVLTDTDELDYYNGSAWKNVANLVNTADRAVVTDANGGFTSATTTATEIGYVNGVTSAIQTQMNLKAPLAAPAFTGSGTVNSARLGGVVGGSGTTTSGSNLTVTHGLGATPTAVNATVRSNTYSAALNTNIFVGNIGATTFTVFANNGAGGAVAAAFNWMACS